MTGGRETASQRARPGLAVLLRDSASASRARPLGTPDEVSSSIPDDDARRAHGRADRVDTRDDADLISRRRADPGHGRERSAVVATHDWTGGATLASRGGVFVMWLAIACGPVALLAGLLLPQQPVEEPAPVAVVASDERPAEALAVAFVGAWLSATVTEPEPFTTLLPGAIVEANRPTPYRDLTVADVTVPDAAGVVGVTVGGLLDETAPLEPGTGETAVPSTWVPRYFQVAVATVGGTSVLAEPAEVAPPLPAAQVVDASHLLDRSSEAVGAVELFLSAYLTSASELDRFIAPDATIAPLPGAPYVSLTLREVRSQASPPAPPAPGDQLEVRAEALVVSRSETTRTLVYWLTLTARDGRWEVAAIGAGPAAPPTDLEP